MLFIKSYNEGRLIFIFVCVIFPIDFVGILVYNHIKPIGNRD